MEIQKKIDEITNNRITDMSELKGEIEKLLSELNTLKNKHNDILNQVNENRNQIEIILSNLKEKKDNFNLANNLASISLPGVKSRKIDNADLVKLHEELDELRNFIETKIME